MTEWQKDIDRERFKIKNLYWDEILPDDINIFIKDVYTKGFSLGEKKADMPLRDFLDDLMQQMLDLEGLVDTIKTVIENTTHFVKENLAREAVI